MKKDYKYTINGQQFEVAIGDIDENTATVIVNGEEYKVEMEPEPEEEKKVVVRKPVAAESSESSESAESTGSVNTNNAIKAPLPGVITSVEVNVGDEVKADLCQARPERDGRRSSGGRRITSTRCFQ